MGSSRSTLLPSCSCGDATPVRPPTRRTRTIGDGYSGGETLRLELWCKTISQSGFTRGTFISSALPIASYSTLDPMLETTTRRLRSSSYKDLPLLSFLLSPLYASRTPPQSPPRNCAASKSLKKKSPLRSRCVPPRVRRVAPIR